MNATKAFMFSTLLGLAACANRSQPQTSDDLAKNGSVKVEASNEVDEDAFKLELSSPDPKSARGTALAAIEHGSEFVLYSLMPEGPPPPPPPPSKHEEGSKERMSEEKNYLDAWYKKKDESCKNGKCLYRNQILGKVELSNQEDIGILKGTLRSTLGKVPNFGYACAAEYRHAISFISDGKHYDIMLCYHCAQVGVAIDGSLLEDEQQAYEMGKQSDLDAMLTKAGIPLAPKPNW